jgi:hypothetical protein
MTRLLLRLVAAGVVLLVRVLLGLLALVGLRGTRVARLAATILGIGWAANLVGLRAAAMLTALVWLVWLVWATRHQRARLRDRVALRRLTRALETRLETRSRALATAPKPASVPRPGRNATRDGDALAGALASGPRLAASQTPEQAMRTLERYAAAWTRRHTHPVTDHADHDPPISQHPPSEGR